MDFYIGTSRDGANFDKSWIHARKPLVPRCRAGAFDKDGIKPPSQILNVGDEHWIYYGGMNERHYSIGRDLKIGLAKLRLDRFIGLAARDKPGTVVTRPFKVAGRTLQMDVDARAGRVQVEILDQHGDAISGFAGNDIASYGDTDQLRLVPRWRDNADLSSLVGRVVRLRFQLTNAKLYAFQIK